MTTGRDMAAVSVIPEQAGIHPSPCQAAFGLALI
jgi:hypothetical protein